MTRQELANHLEGNGWRIDRFGHYHKTSGERKLRMKMQAKSVRYERQVRFEGSQYSPAKNEWVRCYSGYYGKLSIKNGKIAGLTR